MASRDKIRSTAKDGRVRELVALGKSSREIAAILTAEGCNVSHETVAKFVREETTDRRDAAKAVAAADAQATVPFVTDGLRKLAGIALRRAESTDDDSAAARLVAAGQGALATLHKITVGDEPQKNGADVMAELGEILDRKRRRTE